MKSGEVESLRAAGVKFVARHSDCGIDPEAFPDNGPIREEHCRSSETAERLSKLWLAIRNRILGCKCDGIAYGYIGVNVE